MILLVDDDVELISTLAEFLSRNGYMARCAKNGKEALVFLSKIEDRPDVILLDLAMSELDGWEFLAQREKNSYLADVPVLVLTGLRGVEKDAKRMGPAAVLHKPVDPNLLLAVADGFFLKTFTDSVATGSSAKNGGSDALKHR